MLRKRSILVSILSSLFILYVVVGSFLFKVKASDGKTYEALKTFQNVYKIALDKYVDPVNPDKLTMGALRGLLESVDGYSAFYTKKEYDYIEKKNEKKGNVGIVISPHLGYYKVMAIIPGTNASKSGLLIGDTISEIDGKGVSDYTYLYVKALLKGDVSTPVKISVQRGSDEEDLYEVTLKREVIKPVIATSKILQDGIGYLKIYAINKGSFKDIEEKLLFLKRKGIKKLIVDIRDSYGDGYKDAISLADLFLEKGKVMAMLRGSGIPDKKFVSTEKVDFDGEVVLILNGTTWQAPEVFALALKSNNRAKLIGYKSFGGAGVQKFIEMYDGNVLYLTYGVFSSPDGKPLISEKYRYSGVKPDLKYPPEEFAMDLYSKYILSKGEIAVKYYKEYKKRVYKKQLEKAIEILKGKIFHKKAA